MPTKRATKRKLLRPIVVRGWGWLEDGTIDVMSVLPFRPSRPNKSGRWVRVEIRELPRLPFQENNVSFWRIIVNGRARQETGCEVTTTTLGADR